MYIEYMIIDRDFLESEELSREPIWCAYELENCGNKIAIGICGSVPIKYRNQAFSFGEVDELLHHPYIEVSLVRKRELAKQRREI